MNRLTAVSLIFILLWLMMLTQNVENLAKSTADFTKTQAEFDNKTVLVQEELVRLILEK